MLKRSVPLWALVLAVLAISGVVLGAIFWQQTIPGQVVVKGYEFMVYRSDGITPLTSIDLGAYDVGGSNEFPFMIKNVGDYNAYTYAYFDGEASKIMTFTIVQVDVWGGTPIRELNGTSITIGAILKFELRFAIKSESPRGTFPLELTIYASDKASGGP